MQKNYDFELPELTEDDFVYNSQTALAITGAYVFSPESLAKTPLAVAHCDCEPANDMAGANITAARARSTGLCMQRVTATKDGNCPFCGCHAFLRSIEKSNKNCGSIYGQRGIKASRTPSSISKWHNEDGLKSENKVKLVKNEPISITTDLIAGSLK